MEIDDPINFEASRNSSDGANRQAAAGRMHPLFHKAIIGVVLWSLLAAWATVAGPALWLVAIAVFGIAAIVAALPPYNLWRHGGDGTFHRWSRAKVTLFDNEVFGWEALMEAMAPLFAIPVILTFTALARYATEYKLLS